MENKKITAMITNQWYVVFESNEVKSRPVGVTRLCEILVFWRNAFGKIFAARNVILTWVLRSMLDRFCLIIQPTHSKVIPFKSTL
ncbi:MAG: hypothetical protein CVU46_04235 [Chloroflexi bacterium HGW-Chloroflexi-8]|nr:MAG: hypothetical protein CVU46_04235 [Chloroflexi bacterium HGW-Chloroflexi-8]